MRRILLTMALATDACGAHAAATWNFSYTGVLVTYRQIDQLESIAAATASSGCPG